MSYAALKTHLVEDYLARLDKMGMRQSVEGRVPLLDPHLARYTFRLSQEQKVDGFQQKALFRRVVTPLLPDYVTRRPKQGFCPPVAAWTTRLIAKRANNGSPLIDSGILAPDVFRRLPDKGSPRTAFALWTLGTLAAWCDVNL
jgi:asparagine synthase (glutamine-hydrolysing)